MQVDRIAAVVIYPGASAESVETAIVRPVEEAIRGVDGIKHYYSDATEGRALFNVELTRDTDIDTARSDIERAINEVENLPEVHFAPKGTGDQCLSAHHSGRHHGRHDGHRLCRKALSCPSRLSGGF